MLFALDSFLAHLMLLDFFFLTDSQQRNTISLEQWDVHKCNHMWMAPD